MNRQVRKFAKQFVIGLVVGIAGATLFDHFVIEAGLALPDLHEGAAFTSVLLVLMGASILAVSFSSRQVAEAFGGEWEAGEDYSEDRRSVRAQGVVTLLAAVEMAVLAIRPEALQAAALPVLIGLAVLLAAQSAINIRIWRTGGEFLQRLMMQVGALSFLAFQFLLFLWVVGARLGRLPDPSALDVYVAAMIVYLVASLWISARMMGSKRAVI